MEIDQLKSATEEQMEMLMMMDKLPPVFYSAYGGDAADDHHLAQSPQDILAVGASSSSCNNGANSMTSFMGSPHLANAGSPPFMNLPTTLSFTGNNTQVHQDQQSPPPAADFLSITPGTARWRGTVGEIPGADAYLRQSQKKNSMAAMREMIFRIAAMQPIHIDPESVKPPKRRNVKISKDPQSVAARHRRERISERIRILQRLVPGGTKMDTASMLDEAIHYVKFLKTQVQSLERAQGNRPTGIGFPVAMSSGSYLPMGKAYQQPSAHHHRQQKNVQHYGDAN